jgi:hypothetical protein
VKIASHGTNGTNGTNGQKILSGVCFDKKNEEKACRPVCLTFYLALMGVFFYVSVMSEFIGTSFAVLILTVIIWNIMNAFHDPRDPMPRPTHAHTLAFLLALGIAVSTAVYATVSESYGAVWPFIFAAYYVRHFGRIMVQDVR